MINEKAATMGPVFVEVFLCETCAKKCEGAPVLYEDIAGCAGCAPGTLMPCKKLRVEVVLQDRSPLMGASAKVAIEECDECMRTLCNICGHERCPECIDDCDAFDCIEWKADSGTKKHICDFPRCAKHQQDAP